MGQRAIFLFFPRLHSLVVQWSVAARTRRRAKTRVTDARCAPAAPRRRPSPLTRTCRPQSLFLLFESSSGYALFERSESEEIAGQVDAIQDAQTDVKRFSKCVSLKAFVPFTSAEDALSNINDISEGELNELLKNFLEANLPKASKKSKFKLGVCEPKIGQAIQEQMSVSCQSDREVNELIRGIRYHFDTFIKDLAEADISRAQLGLGHAYSRSKVKFNVNRSDNMVIQAIALLDQLDKDLNTFTMRAREWYSWHFPELVKLVPDNYTYARCAKQIKNKSSLLEADAADALEAITGDAEVAKAIVDASKISMGTEVADLDMINIENFCDRVISLSDYRRNLQAYLASKMAVIAPNLSTLIGDQVGARLISHAGSLTNLAKYPASTVQILGAEKALFRALKTRSNTPKYGLIFNSSFIGRAGAKNKGRISRYLANKCSMASRIDSFSDVATTVYGEALKNQVEERLAFYNTGAAPKKNMDVMSKAMKEVAMVDGDDDDEDSSSKKSKKDKKEKKDKKKKSKE